MRLWIRAILSETITVLAILLQTQLQPNTVLLRGSIGVTLPILMLIIVIFTKSIILSMIILISSAITSMLLQVTARPLIVMLYFVPGMRGLSENLVDFVNSTATKVFLDPSIIALSVAISIPISLFLMRLVYGGVSDEVLSNLGSVDYNIGRRNKITYWSTGVFITILLVIYLKLTNVLYVVGVIVSSALSMLARSKRAGISVLAWMSWILLPITVSLIVEGRGDVGKRVEGIRLGRVRAVLKYGVPTITWMPNIIRYSSRGKCWHWSRSRGYYYLNVHSQLNPHIVLFGGSGAGKSKLAMRIVKNLYINEGIPFVVIDLHNEYVDLIKEVGGEIIYADKECINPLELDGASPRDRIVQVADSIARVFKLGPLQKATLEEVLEEAYAYNGIVLDEVSTWSNPAPTFSTALMVLDRIVEEAGSWRDKSRIEAIAPYLRVLSSNIFKKTTLSVGEIMRRPTTIALAGVPGDSIKAVITETLLRKIFHYIMTRGHSEKIVNYIVIDEAHRVCRRGAEPSLVARLIMESRKYGVGFIVITQQPRDIDESIIANAAIKISLRVMEPQNLDYTAKTIAGFQQAGRLESVRQAIYYLPPKHIVLKDSISPEPMIVEVD